MPSLPPASTLSSSPPFLSLPDVIRERIYFFVLTVDVDPCAPWVAPLPIDRHLPRSLPGLPPKPDGDLEDVSKAVRKKRRRKIRAWEQIRQEMTVAVQAARPHSCLAILATCRTILVEAFHIWYKSNTLSFHRSEDVYDFLVSISRARANEIRSVRLNLASQDWRDAKAKFALKGLVKLEKVIFVYNDYSSPHTTNVNFIGCPKIISQLRGLQQVTFLDPENTTLNNYGLKFGMSDSVKSRMDELRQEMLTKGKRPRCAPPMVDLFGRLKVKDHSKKDSAGWGWEEDLAYAPEFTCNSSVVGVSDGASR
ncbi:MAG: hypothetical protein LQ338_000586 [Usnochroma carphineum]|nr:MAG: hypothetical protein LQ338_000586 [Usnochroma carphineum]